MNLKIDFDYIINFVPYRHQNKQVEYGKSSVDIEIDEFASSDVPLVAKIANQSNNNLGDSVFNEKSEDLDDTTKELRFKDGKFYIERYSVDDFLKAIKGTMQEGVFERGSWKQTVFEPAGRDKKPSWKPYRTGEEMRRSQPRDRPHRYIEDDGGKQKADTIKKLASRVAIIDGVVFEQVAEPIVGFRSTGQIGIFRRPAPSFYNKYSMGDDFVDSYDLYGHYALKTTSILYDPLEVVGHDPAARLPYIDVYDHSVFTYDTTSYDVMKIIDTMCHSWNQAYGYPLPMLEAVIDFRDAYDDAHGRVTQRLLDTVKAISEVVIDPAERERIRIRAKRSQERGVSSVPKIDISFLKTTAEFALERWGKRDPQSVWAVEGAITRVKIDGCDVFELGSKGEAIDYCVLSGMSFNDALYEIEAGGRILVMSGSNWAKVAMLDDFDEIRIISPVDESEKSHIEAGFSEFVDMKNEADLRDEELASFNINFDTLGV